MIAFGAAQHETYERTSGLAEEVCAAGVADGQGSKRVDDVTSLFVRTIRAHDKALALDGGLDAQQVLCEEGMRDRGVLRVRDTKAVFELSHTVRQLEDFLVKVLCGGKHESGCPGRL